MKCINCGADNLETYKFCINCGSALTQPEENKIDTPEMVEPVIESTEDVIEVKENNEQEAIVAEVEVAEEPTIEPIVEDVPTNEEIVVPTEPTPIEETPVEAVEPVIEDVPTTPEVQEEIVVPTEPVVDQPVIDSPVMDEVPVIEETPVTPEVQEEIIVPTEPTIEQPTEEPPIGMPATEETVPATPTEPVVETPVTEPAKENTETFKNVGTTNWFAIIGFVLSLLFGGLISLILSIVGLVKVKTYGKGKGLSIAGIIICILKFIAVIVLSIILITSGLLIERQDEYTPDTDNKGTNITDTETHKTERTVEGTWQSSENAKELWIFEGNTFEYYEDGADQTANYMKGTITDIPGELGIVAQGLNLEGFKQAMEANAADPNSTYEYTMDDVHTITLLITETDNENIPLNSQMVLTWLCVSNGDNIEGQVILPDLSISYYNKIR